MILRLPDTCSAGMAYRSGAALLLLCMVFGIPHRAANAERDAGASELATLAELRWQHRLVVVLETSSPGDDIAELEKHASQLQERDVIWFVLDANQVATNFPRPVANGFGMHLRNTFGRGPPVILVGKDGGIKMRSTRLKVSEIVSRIDAMPMRQRESRQST